ncbi:PP2C family protein-serine/threonine phosphatase [Microbulbifer aggregans]|uniref:PP2C family protein-serine/threonine phosphatase n=1 Tax=Microbulbifer aggregans TaxID=1769779 RepID=UPI001CFEAE28|nr:protein phosphatase 2C domain-containing protein [Microbulbifer aggregans]
MSEAKVRERPSGVSHSAVHVNKRSAGATHTGYRRDQNEDAFWGDESRGVWVVADGLGGHQAGEIASQTVVEEIQRSSATDRHYEQALRRAHALLIGEESSSTAMGTTAVVVAEDGNYFHVYWVGDSRAYVWTPATPAENSQETESTAPSSPSNFGHLTQLTVDHSYVQMLVDSGAINADEAANHPNKHVITRCIGGSANPALEIDRASFAWKPGQKLLICSDGLSNDVSEYEICQVLAENTDNQRAAELLIAAALDAGGRDNITVQLVGSPEQAKQFSQNHDSRTVAPIHTSGQSAASNGKLALKLATIAGFLAACAGVAWWLLQA